MQWGHPHSYQGHQSLNINTPSGHMTVTYSEDQAESEHMCVEPVTGKKGQCPRPQQDPTKARQHILVPPRQLRQPDKGAYCTPGAEGQWTDPKPPVAQADPAPLGGHPIPQTPLSIPQQSKRRPCCLGWLDTGARHASHWGHCTVSTVQGVKTKEREG